MKLPLGLFSTEGSVNEDVVVTKPSGMTCREIRRNSAGCIKLRGECEKCVAIQDIGKALHICLFSFATFT